MMTQELRDRAFQFFNDSRLTYDWLHTPCRTFHGASPSDHYSSSPQGEKEVMTYLDSIIETWR